MSLYVENIPNKVIAKPSSKGLEQRKYLIRLH